MPPEFTRDVHADTAGAEGRAWSGPLGGDRGVVAPGTEVHHIRGIVVVGADLKLFIQGHVDFGVTLIKTGISFGEIAIDRKSEGDRVGVCYATRL